jgi:hypothetical protein
MDPNSRYIVSQTRMSERRAEADRARLAKGDPFGDPFADTMTEARRTTAHGRSATTPSLLGRLIGLRPHFGGRPAAPSATPAG